MDNHDRSIFNNNTTVILIAVGSAALVVTIYHLIAVCLCNRHGIANQFLEQQDAQGRSIVVEMPNNGLVASQAQIIPVHKYEKNKLGLMGEDDGFCAVCLCEFEEGEELRTLPECMHSFHVPCIDLWLYSHSSCPMCRTAATPTPTPTPMTSNGTPPVDYVTAGSAGEVNIQQNMMTVQNVVAQSRMM